MAEPTGYFGSTRPNILKDLLIDPHSTKLNRISDGCKFYSKRYTRRDITIGTTQSFDEAYFRYAGRRLRMFRGEYAYPDAVTETCLVR